MTSDVIHIKQLMRSRGQKPKIVKTKTGTEVYFPWSKKKILLPDKKTFEDIRQSRNRDLVLPEERKKLRKLKIAVAGLNVGNPAALCMVLEGVGSYLKFADNDILTLDNLNRFRASLADLGLNKAVLSARQAYEINPFLEIEVLPEGIDEKNINKFLLHPRVDVLVEETDNLKLKIALREAAKKNGIPVVMVTGNEEDVIVDIERFDLDPELPLLNGFLKKEVMEKIKNLEQDAGKKEKALLARDFMGREFLKKRLVDSFDKVLAGRLDGIPQLAESSFLRGAAVCFAVRQIALKQKCPSGRYFLKLSEIFK